jgi:hypothetical protein
MHLKRKWMDRRVYEYFAVTVAPWLNWRDPILIYQMGKVGSSSIRNSLFRCEDPRTQLVLMSHEYFPVRCRDPARIEIEPEYLPMLAREIAHDRRVYEQFSLRKRMGWRFREKFYAERIYKTWVRSRHQLRVITLVREPVANNISMFFQIMDQYLSKNVEPSNCSVEELIDLFINNYMHSRPLTWLDAEIKTNFGIDVYQTPFPVDQGYSVISQGRTSVLVLRCELSDQAKAAAIADFLGIEHFEIIRSNVSGAKSYAEQYAEFKRRITIPPALLDQMYNSKFARHFYSEGEREQFRAQWSAKGSGDEKSLP